MRKLLASKWVRAGAVLVIVLGTAAGLACWRWRVWSITDFRAYREVRRYPPGDDLWFGRVGPGEGLEAFTAAHPPHRVLRLGRYTLMSYYTEWPTPPNSIPMESLTVVAEDGRLVQAAAAGCTWGRVFFEMPPESAAEFEQEWQRRYGQ